MAKPTHRQGDAKQTRKADTSRASNQGRTHASGGKTGTENGRRSNTVNAGGRVRIGGGEKII